MKKANAKPMEAKAGFQMFVQMQGHGRPGLLIFANILCCLSKKDILICNRSNKRETGGTLQLKIYLDGQGWGEAIIQNIQAVLRSVDLVFRPCFGQSMNTKDLLVVHSDDHPVTYSEHNVVLLSAKDRYWCKYAYQFAHEYCHFQIGGSVPQQLRWFEESLCELASYFFLPRIADLWETDPPYQNWQSYAEQFRIYAMQDQQKATSFDLNFSVNSDVLMYLAEHEYDRQKNAYVAIVMMPVFEAKPELWSVVHIIKNIPKNLSFAESMRCWRDLAPKTFRNDVETIAQLFSITLRSNCNDDLNITQDERPCVIDK